MTEPRLLDLFCGAGGAADGYRQAGFHVTGVDWIDFEAYVGDEFVHAEALAYVARHGHEYDVIHASPPCQAYSPTRNFGLDQRYPRLVEATRVALRATGKPYVIENVVGAPLHHPVRLCGTMFGLGTADAELRRHRLFESNLPLVVDRSCCHGQKPRTIGVYGHGIRDPARRTHPERPDFSVRDGRVAMGIDWMSLSELCQAIPPAYTEYLGHQIREFLHAT